MYMCTHTIMMYVHVDVSKCKLYMKHVELIVLKLSMIFSMLVIYCIFISICRSDKDPVPKHSSSS